MDRKIRTRLASFAKSLEGPLGNVPLDRAIRSDLELFRELRDSGASWVQIANALIATGARRADGSVITADHIRSAVSRQLKRQATDAETAATSAQHDPVKPTTAPASRTDRRPPSSGIKPPPAKPLHSTKSTTGKRSSILQKLARTRQLRET